MEVRMSSATPYLTKLLGLFLLSVGISIIVQGQNTLDVWATLLRNLPLVYVVGLVAVAAGLAMVLSHNVWKGGALPITVTVLFLHIWRFPRLVRCSTTASCRFTRSSGSR
jgi:hypothetical protein